MGVLVIRDLLFGPVLRPAFLDTPISIMAVGTKSFIPKYLDPLGNTKRERA